MQSVIAIHEESHGFRGVAATYKDAIHFLMESGYLNDYTEVCAGTDPTIWEYKRISEVLGEDWVDLLCEKWTVSDFNDYFMDSFYLEPLEVYGAE